jgi:hypothetical protein
MSKLVMDRHAYDNVYFHRDFHSIFNVGLQYLSDVYGNAAVVEYLKDYTRNYYSDKIQAIRENGLDEIKKIIEQTYKAEQATGAVEFQTDGDILYVKVKYCPAVTFMRENGVDVYENYSLTSNVVYKTLAEDAGLEYEMQSYEKQTGKALHVFKNPSKGSK